MKSISSLMKTFSTGLLLGAFAAFFICLIGFFAIFIYGVTHPPQNIHLTLLSQKIFDFSSTNATTFEMTMNPLGMLYLIMALMLLGGIVLCILKGVFRTSSVH